jgi:hypothetical protein
MLLGTPEGVLHRDTGGSNIYCGSMVPAASL